jgi:putative restriction endonuclease
MPVSQEYRAFLGWNFLTKKALAHNISTYSELAVFVGVHPRVTRFFLALIQDYCLNRNLPPLTILVVNTTGHPGPGFIAWDINQFEAGKQSVFDYNWLHEENPFNFAVKGNIENQIIQELVSNPLSANDIYIHVRVRGVSQSIFRQALLKVYNSSCAVCGLTYHIALEATHIIPWSENENERLNIKNGLLLCSVHHKLFDSGAFVVNDDYSISVNNNINEYPIQSEFDRKMLTAFNGLLIILPQNNLHYPDLRFIQYHRQHFTTI